MRSWRTMSAAAGSRVLSGLGIYSEAPSDSALKLISALRRVRVEAMMMIRLRFFANSKGSAEMPSRSGISISSTATSGSTRSIWLTASRPVRSDAATTMSGSDPSQRAINPLITTESSTTITRNGSCRVAFGIEELANATLIVHQIRLKRHYWNDNAEGHSAPGGPRSHEANFRDFPGDHILAERIPVLSVDA